MNRIETITPIQLFELMKGEKEIDLIDVRTPAEYTEVHIAGAKSVPLDSLNPELVMRLRNGSESEPVYIICRTGNRSGMACERLIKAGLTNIVNVESGIRSWEQSGLSVERGKKIISLERQVRISAGALVLIGSLLGIFLNIYFVLLSAFVGAGLIFAGVTDTCGMAMLLARMPWNQSYGEQVSCSR
jgi:rhodanese-related sulfurtransferase